MNDDDPAIGAYEGFAQRELLERATTQLKASSLFKSFSRRLLFDLVERSGLHVLGHGPGFLHSIDERPSTDLTDPQAGPFLAIVVLKGTVLAKQRHNDREVTLETGVYLRGDPALIEVTPGQLRLERPKDGSATLVPVGAGALVDAPTAAWSLDVATLPEAVRNTDTVQSARGAELIWVTAAAYTGVALEAALHILGAAAAREVRETGVLLYILGPNPQFLVWDYDHFSRVPGPPPDPGELLDLPGKQARIFFCHPAAPQQPPQQAGFAFDRIVLLTTQMPSVLPEEFANLLRPNLLNGRDESIFSSFIASVLVDYDPTPVPGGGLCRTGKFETRPLPCGAPKEPVMRPYRDTCVLRIDATRLQRAWQTWIQEGPEQIPPFVDVAAREQAMRKNTSQCWARAVTNRRVGFALSGGGASAYRAGPLLRRIAKARIPIDVFAALSGGALVGAFCCHSGLKGFARMKRLGPFFQLTLPLVLVWTWPFEAFIDALLGGTRVEHLERRFAAVAVSLPETSVPQATVVVKGTLGEAARVSGNLPPSFAPATKNCIRYADGGAGTVVPAQAARDCGADVVLACNAIPGPARGNPLSAFPGAAWLRWTPFLGRMIDSYTWYSFFFCQTSREFGDDAEVFVEFAPQNFPLMESTTFIAAQHIVDQAEAEGPNLDCKVAELKRHWLNLQPPSSPAPTPSPASRRRLAKRKARKSRPPHKPRK
jgi:predicted acylesterase/phospholipase RssA